MNKLVVSAEDSRVISKGGGQEVGENTPSSTPSFFKVSMMVPHDGAER